MRCPQFYNPPILVSALVAFIGCTSSKPAFTSSAQKEEIKQEELYALRNVNIIPMTTENKVIENATIVIKDKKIFSINKPIPSEARVIEGRGK